MRKLLALLFLLTLSVSAHAATYYVDFDSGNDANNGTTTGTPWKHCPGDNDAAGVADTTALSAGDTVLFAGGVVYRGGGISNVWNGSAGSPITYKGDGWGTGNAIVDGSVPLDVVWTACTDAGDCFGNTNFANIWHTTATTTFFIPRYQAAQYLRHSQEPDPNMAVNYQSSSHYYFIDPDSTTQSVTRTSITDPDVFTQTDANYWDESYVTILYGTNSKAVALITGFDPDTDTVTFSDIGGDLYLLDGFYWYSVMNHPGLIDLAGEFGIKDGQIYLWGLDNPNTEPVSVWVDEQIGFHASGCDWIVYEGFDIRSFYSPDSLVGGCGIRMQRNLSERSKYCIVRNNEVSLCGNDYPPGGIEGGAIEALKMDYSTITANYVHDCMQSTGINVGGESNVITSNTVMAASGQGIFAAGCTTTTIDHNLVTYIQGSHSNGISGYASCQNLLVAHNTVEHCNQPMTFQVIVDLYLFGNLVDADSGPSNVTVHSAMTGSNNLVAFNTLVNNVYSSGDKALLSFPADAIILNNFIDGYNSYCTFRRDNIYLGNPPGTLLAGEVTQTDMDVLFDDPVADDYRLLGSSIARNSAYDVSSYLPTELFPNYDFTVDLDDKARPASYTDWDIGAYEYDTPPVQGDPQSSPGRHVYAWQGGVYVWDE